MMNIPSELIEACKKNKCVPFVGAGFSAQSNLPMWSGVISDMKSLLLEKALNRQKEEVWLSENGALEIAERFKHALTPSQYQQFLEKWFEPPGVKPSEAHRMLISIQWPVIVTTNFDKLIEQAFVTERGSFVRTPSTFEQIVRAETTGKTYIIKLHGTIEEPESIVLTESDYAHFAIENKEMIDHIEKSMLTFRRVLFLGFSMKDPEIRSVFLRSRILSKGYAVGDFIVLTSPHYADVEIWEKRGLTVISLDSHSELPKFLARLANLIALDTNQNDETQTTANPAIQDVIKNETTDVTLLPQLPEYLVSLNVTFETGRLLDKNKIQYTLPEQFGDLLQTGPVISIYGEAGAGKSTILRSAVEYLRGKSAHFLFIKASKLEKDRISMRKWLSNAQVTNLHNLTVLVDGLDECNRELSSAIINDLSDTATRLNGFTAVVTSRPTELSEFKETTRFLIQPLTEPEFLTLAHAKGQDEDSRVLQIFRLAPSLHGRPLHARSLGDYVESIGKEPESEADYALWLLDRNYIQAGIDDECRSWIELTAAELYLSCRMLNWNLADWAQAALHVLTEEREYRSVLRAIQNLTGEGKPFIQSNGVLTLGHRTIFEAMVGRGLARLGTLNRLLAPDSAVDDSSIMIACAIKTMSNQLAIKSIGVVVKRAPWLAARVLLGAGAQSEIRNLLLNREFELDLRAAIRHGIAILGISPFIDFVTPLFSRSLRNPSLLSEAVDALDTICETLSHGRELTRAKALLASLWKEHKQKTCKVEWVDIQGGYYSCGTNSGLDSDEEPSHSVFLNPFRIAKYQITNIQFEQFCSQHVRNRLSLDDEMPVVNITWYEAQLYCRWITGNCGGRLPSEAEWETAARGNTSTKFYWGNKYNKLMANCGEDARGMHKVGDYMPNPFDLYDMAGNVYEWCLDWYDELYYQECPTLNPLGPINGRLKVMRGGSWGRSVNAASSTYRVRQVPETRDVLVGFRACWPHHLNINT